MKKTTTHAANGFTLIEVLVAMLLLTIAVLTVNAAFKQFVGYQDKMSHYEKIYTTVLSLRDELSTVPLVSGEEKRGEMNGLDYQYKVTLIDRRKNFDPRQLFEQEEVANSFELSLFKIALVAGGHNFEFLQTRFQRR